MGWALDGHGILMRSLWEAAPVLASGRLRPVLSEWALPPADIYAVFPTRSHTVAAQGGISAALANMGEEYRRLSALAAGKKLVIWLMTARDLHNYWEDWEPLKKP